MAIKTPLTHDDALTLATLAFHGSAAQALKMTSVLALLGGREDAVAAIARIGAVLMAADVASREQERERCARIVEQDIDGPGDPMEKTLRRLAKEIRDPETIPEEQEVGGDAMERWGQ